MTLIEVFKKLNHLDDELTIYAEEPWTLDSKTILEYALEPTELPDKVKESNCTYFMEIFVANEFVEGLTSMEFNTAETKCNRLIEYSIYDS